MYYTLLFTAPGTYASPGATPTGGVENVGLPDMIGPNTSLNGPGQITPSPTICGSIQNTKATGNTTPGDSYQIVAVGLDYDLYSAMVPISKAQNPKIVGPHGQDDMTISFPASGTAGAY